MISKKRILRRSVYGYAMMLVVNPLIILSFQNCSVAKLERSAKPAKADKSEVRPVIPQEK